MMKDRLRIIDLAYIALFSALLSICSWVSVPATIPFTLQTFGVFCVLSVLGGKRGTLSILVFLLLGAVGLPVFANFMSGPGVLFGTTGGYLIGFLFSGLLYLMFEKLCGKERLSASIRLSALVLVLCLAVCYAFGTAWFLIVYAQKSGPIGLATALGWCVFPFILPDLAKLALALYISRRLKPFLK